MKLFTGKNNEIRRVMRKYSLRVNRLKRVSYGPYTLEQYVPNPNDICEVKMSPELRKLMYNYYKTRTLEANNKIEDTKQQQLIQESLKTNKAKINKID